MERLGHLEPRQAVAAEGGELVVAHLAAEDDEGGAGLTPALVGDADHGRLGDCGV